MSREHADTPRVVWLITESPSTNLILSRALAEQAVRSAALVLVAPFRRSGRIRRIYRTIKSSSLHFVAYKAIELYAYYASTAIRRLFLRHHLPRAAVLAARYGVPVHRVEGFSDTRLDTWLGSDPPDLFFSVHCAQKVPSRLLSLARYGGVNLHPAPLPFYRGTFPYFWVLHDGVEDTAVTLHVMTDSFDAGPILAQQRLAVAKGESLASLSARGALLEADVVSKFLADLAAGSMPAGRLQPQDAGSYYSWPTPADYVVFRRHSCLVRPSELSRFLQGLPATANRAGV